MSLDQRSWNIGWDAGYGSVLTLIERLCGDDPEVHDENGAWCWFCESQPTYLDVEHAEDCPWVEARALIAAKAEP